jgi:hypothetical protein
MTSGHSKKIFFNHSRHLRQLGTSARASLIFKKNFLKLSSYEVGQPISMFQSCPAAAWRDDFFAYRHSKKLFCHWQAAFQLFPQTARLKPTESLST